MGVGVFRKGRRIAVVVKVCDTHASRALGLMFQEPLNTGEAYLFVTPSGGDGDVLSTTIHMWFVRAPIDVVWLDREFTVVGVAEGVPPASLLHPMTWRTYGPSKPAMYVIELAFGTLKKSRGSNGILQLGEKLEVKNTPSS